MVSSTFISNVFKMNGSAAEYHIYNLNFAERKPVVAFLAFSFGFTINSMQIAVITKRKKYWKPNSVEIMISSSFFLHNLQKE